MSRAARPRRLVARWKAHRVHQHDAARRCASSDRRETREQIRREPKSDVRVITSAVYRSNGGGWNDPERPVASVGDRRPARPDDAEGAPADERRVLRRRAPSGPATAHVSSSPRRASADAYYQPGDSDRRTPCPSTGGEITKIADIDGTIGSLKVSPDGRSIAFIGALGGTPERSYSQSDLFVAPIGSTPKNLTAGYDFDIGGGIGGDQAAPRGGSTRGPDLVGGRLVDRRRRRRAGRRESRSRRRRQRRRSRRCSRARTRCSPTPRPHDASTIVALASTPTNIGDVFVVSGGLQPQAGHAGQRRTCSTRSS